MSGPRHGGRLKPLILAMHEKGVHYRDIAEELGCHYVYAWFVLREMGLSSIRKRSGRKPRRNDMPSPNVEQTARTLARAYYRRLHLSTGTREEQFIIDWGHLWIADARLVLADLGFAPEDKGELEVKALQWRAA